MQVPVSRIARSCTVLCFAAAAAAVLLSTASPAAAFHPFDDTYGYEPPGRKAAREQRAPAVRTIPPSRLPPVRAPQSFWFDDDEEERDRTTRPQTRRETVKGPPVLDGGGRPSIAPATPPVVSFPNSFGRGEIIIDTAGRALYYVLSPTTAYRYPISVGRVGFTWTGTQRISRVASWPDWRPPAEMKERQPGLPDLMTGGVRNPLGARALYLGNSLYRIHGTNDVATIGQAASSGCFRMMNAHVIHLSGLAGVGTTVRVMSSLPRNIASARANRG